MTRQLEEDRVYQLERYHQRMKEMREYLGNVCVECGTDINLEIHHKNPEDKSFDLSKSWGIPWDKLIAELDKCELRCEDHHTEIHAPKHGTISSYRHRRCRCDACRLAWNEASKRWAQSSRNKRI